MKELKKILPDFPRTSHVPYKAVFGENLTSDDSIASDLSTNVVFTGKSHDFTDLSIFVEEKIDGANCGMALYEGHPVIRNRSHILNKGYVKDTPAKMQFRPAWGWFYDNKEKFEKLNELAGFEVGVFGEWCYALHGIRYDKLPSFFIAYDLFDWYPLNFIATAKARELLTAAGFSVPPLLHTGKAESWEQLEALCNEQSAFSTTDKREGLYIKISNDKHIVDRYKMVRSDYVQGCNWDLRTITKNKLVSDASVKRSTKPE